ncbi:MAG: hypothetical protein ACOCR1_05050 [Planctomycetota bacterium]
MVEAQCVVCHNNKADFRCIECHKPVCDECAFKDTNGVFCTRDCAAKYDSYRKHQPAESTKGSGVMSGLIRKIAFLIVLALAAMGVYVYGALQGWFGEEKQEKMEQQMEEVEEKQREGEEKLNKMQEKPDEETG